MDGKKKYKQLYNKYADIKAKYSSLKNRCNVMDFKQQHKNKYNVKVVGGMFHIPTLCIEYIYNYVDAFSGSVSEEYKLAAYSLLNYNKSGLPLCTNVLCSDDDNVAVFDITSLQKNKDSNTAGNYISETKRFLLFKKEGELVESDVVSEKLKPMNAENS